MHWKSWSTLLLKGGLPNAVGLVLAWMTKLLCRWVQMYTGTEGIQLLRFSWSYRQYKAIRKNKKVWLKGGMSQTREGHLDHWANMLVFRLLWSKLRKLCLQETRYWGMLDRKVFKGKSGSYLTCRGQLLRDGSQTNRCDPAARAPAKAL